MSAPSSHIDQTTHASLAALMALQYDRTPKHRDYLERRLSTAGPAEMDALEALAVQITALGGPRLPEICDNYDFICRIVREEEMHFRRHGSYRLTTFEEANAEVYSNKDYMSKYMDGLLLTQIYWSNHTACYTFYRDVFLGGAPEGYDYLEIGPGHGLLLYQAIRDPRCASVTGWDLSPASIDATREALEELGATGRAPDLVLQDLYTADESKQFDCVTFSEVLEHLEDPEGAVRKLGALLKPGGRLYINVPINSPAPDHLFLLRSPEETEDFVKGCGLTIEQATYFPMTNHTMEQARKHSLTISACIIATR